MKSKKLTKREKLMIAAVIVCATTAGYFGYKYIGDHKQIVKLTDDTNTLMSAASEGLFDEALATVGRKIVYRKDKEKYLMNFLANNPKATPSKEALDRVQSELQDLMNRQHKFIEAQKLYEIRNEIDVDIGV